MQTSTGKEELNLEKQKERSTRIPAFCPTVQEGAESITDLPAPEHVPAGVYLSKQDQWSSQVRLIRSGIVKLTYLSPAGVEFILGLRSVGWWLGASQVLMDVPNLFNVLTLTPCTVSSMCGDDFSQQLTKNPRMLRHYLSSACREKITQTKLHIMLLSSSAELRLRHMLDEHDNSVWKTLDPTTVMRQADVAKLLAVTPEHLSRVLHKGERNEK